MTVYTVIHSAVYCDDGIPEDTCYLFHNKDAAIDFIRTFEDFEDVRLTESEILLSESIDSEDCPF